MEEKTIKNVLEKCTGCGACYNICDFRAIKMQEDSEGFVSPYIDEDKCSCCGKCAKICPAINVKYANSPEPKLYAVRASDEIRALSSSGGMFTVLAEEILDRNGYVCGAAFDDNMELKHIIVDNKNDLSKLRGSKYVQSNTGMIYAEIEKLLQDKKYVLFTGTPCQVAALYSYLKKEYKTLYTMDVLCHGVPSQKIFHKYLSEIFPEKKIKEVSFRDKSFGWGCRKIRVTADDGNTYIGEAKIDSYLRGFFRNATLRRSCGECPFAEFPRQGDISAGDFWGITNLDATQFDKKGTSLVYINNEKGRELFSAVSSQLKTKQYNFAETKIGNRIQAHQAVSVNRDRIFKFLQNDRFTYDRALKRALGRKYDIGIVSNFYAGNFGGSLTQYALYNVLEDMGYSCLMIERPANAPGRASLETMEKIYIEIPYSENAMARQRRDKEEMAELNNICDSFVVGSDQLFQYSLFNSLGQFVTLDWVDNTKKKIAYAASYGHDRIWGDPKVLAEMGFHMRKFDAFSVREKSGVDISENDFGVNAEWVLDPVFLCKMKYYDKLIAKSERKLPKHYIGSYMLDPTEDKAEILKKCQKELGYKAQIFSEFSHSDEYVKPLEGLDVQHLRVEERLQLIKNCDFFVTDSFHGTCFAIIMRKPFISILNSGRGGSRFESLLSMFGLNDRLITQSEELDGNKKIFSDIDYDKVYDVLDKERERCLEWLKNALEAEKKPNYSDYDILIQLIKEQQDEIRSLKEKVKLLSDTADLSLNTVNDIHEYLEKLRESAGKYTVLIAVKDTPGMSLSDTVARELNEIGLKTNLLNKHWSSYTAIIDGGSVVDEQISDETIRIIKKQIDNNVVSLVSSNYKASDVAKIFVNGTDHAVNRRGLNFVVINKDNNKIADSVCFDMHLKKYNCYRKK